MCCWSKVINVGDYVLMPGIIDSHVHINEPGRTEWEGFETATKAAAAGGITTVVDMPLNSIPPTTTLENLRTKINAARGKTYVDVAFWGGVVPGNQDELKSMVNAGVVGFKCFLCPSGVDEFCYVQIEDVEIALKELENTNSVLAFHAETEECGKLEASKVPACPNTNLVGVTTSCPEGIPKPPLGQANPKNYDTFLETRPPSMEATAIENIIALASKYNVKVHIVHLSAASALPLIVEAKANNLNLTVETCHHYLTLTSNTIPSAATQFKCCPPVRNKENQHLLWDALRRNIIDMVVSDHSPSTPDLKLLGTGNNCGDFLKAWGGIASVQFGLSLFWTESKKRGFTIFDINKYMTRETAKLVGLHNTKGRIAQNYDADFVIWDPNSTITITESIIQYKNKITPYLGMQLQGKVIKTVVRGEIVYEESKEFTAPKGKLLINNAFDD